MRKCLPARIFALATLACVGAPAAEPSRLTAANPPAPAASAPGLQPRQTSQTGLPPSLSEHGEVIRHVGQSQLGSVGASDEYRARVLIGKVLGTPYESREMASKLAEHELQLQAYIAGGESSWQRGPQSLGEFLSSPAQIQAVQPAYSQPKDNGVITPAMVLDLIQAQRLTLQRLDAIEARLERAKIK
jgi:hypothetical protein